jgi:uncharacterized protein YjbI with pentapeptide repeats
MLKRIQLIRIKKPFLFSLLSVVLIGAATWLLYLKQHGYTWSDWTGFKTKTLWDALELLIIPFTLAGVATWLNRLDRKADRNLALDKQREEALQDYIDTISKSIMDKSLTNSSFDDDVRVIAQIKTSTILDRMDNDRKSKLIKFLTKVKLIITTDEIEWPIINLTGTDLQNIILTDINLTGVTLNKANLSGAIFNTTNLYGANLFETKLVDTKLINTCLSWAQLENAKLIGCKMIEGELSNAILSNADLTGASLIKADLAGASLSGAILNKTNLTDAELKNADLGHAKLVNANLTSANLIGAIFENADLFGAILSNANLTKPPFHSGWDPEAGFEPLWNADMEARAKEEYDDLRDANFTGATMPDGKLYDPDCHTEEILTGRKPINS